MRNDFFCGGYESSTVGRGTNGRPESDLKIKRNDK